MEKERVEYTLYELRRSMLALDDPVFQFEKWYNDAVQKDIYMANAMTLATVDESGLPQARIVLLKGFSQDGFSFYTNYDSPKARELEINPNVTLMFFWKEMERQVRITGVVEKLDYDTSLSYFHSRPRDSQISAWASPQSQIVKNREELEANRLKIEDRFKDAKLVPKPENWGGYVLKPSTFEFWQGRMNRFHDRFKYILSDDGSWIVNRLAP